MQQVEAGALILTGAEAVALARLASFGLPIVERVDGPSEAGRALVAQVIRVAQQAQRADQRLRASGCGPAREPRDPGASSEATWLGTAEAGAMCGVSSAYIRRLAGQRRLLAERDSRKAWRIEPSSLMEWSASRNR